MMELDMRGHIAQRVRELRTARGLSLHELASSCGVSRSMISLIERGESSPTAMLLGKLALGLDVPLASLFGALQPAKEAVARSAEQRWWRDPRSGYMRRSISPSAAASPTQIVEVSFPAGAHVAYEFGGAEPAAHQQVWVLEGSIAIAVGDELYELGTGDCLALVLDRPVSYHNPSRRRGRYAVVSTTLKRRSENSQTRPE